MIEQEVTDDTKRRRTGKDEMRGRRRHVYGEAEQIDHERYMDHAAADAERAVERKICGQRVDIRVLLVCGVPVHHQCHHKQE